MVQLLRLTQDSSKEESPVEMDWFTLIFGSISILVQNQSEQYKEADKLNVFPPSLTNHYFPSVETYDFIVVGGGTAGCVVASRLSENPNVRVLLLEAGGDPPPQTQVPAFAPDSRKAPEIVFPYKSIPQLNAYNAVLQATVGKVLGGTSTLNYMFFNRGSPYDYDNWANITRDLSWAYSSVLDYFKKLENYQGEFPLTEHHGQFGPLKITSQEYAPGKETWLQAAMEKGLEVNDPNGPQFIGVNPVEYNKENGRRMSSYDAYVKPIELDRQNLVVRRYADVEKVLINENKLATGVMYKLHGVYQSALASKEIVLSAGAYGTPRILFKSGIGPAEVLERLNIEVKADLPVGENLQDHPIVPVKVLISDRNAMFNPETDLNENTIADFQAHGKGPLTSTTTLSGQAFLASSVAVEEGYADWADIQLSLYSQNFQSKVSKVGEPELAIYVYPYLGRPKSRGTLSFDPDLVPIIDFNVLSDGRDIKILTQAITRTMSLIETTEAYGGIGASYSIDPLEECAHLTFRSDAYWECYIRHTVLGGNHPSGTCRMGYGEGDPGAVVDSKLRLIGLSGLRVADASVMPTITNANIQAAVFMIGEKLSAELKAEWGLQ